jgi:hypothetical protein
MRSLFATALLTCLTLAGQTNERGFVPLFDGKTLKGWTLVDGKGPGYVVENGILVCPADGGGNLFTEKEYANFVLRFEFLLTPGGNNGMGIRAPLNGRASYEGMEIQILDDQHPKYQSRIKPAQYHGSIYDVVPAEHGHKKPTGEWNAEEIVADGRHIKVVLNGHTIVDANLDDVKDPEVLKRHPGLQRTTGHIGLLGHGTRVEFRNIRIKTLD